MSCYRPPMVMFQELSVCPQLGGSYVTITDDALDLTIEGLHPRHIENCSTWTSQERNPLDMFKLVHFEKLASGRLASYANTFLLIVDVNFDKKYPNWLSFIEHLFYSQ